MVIHTPAEEKKNPCQFKVSSVYMYGISSACGCKMNVLNMKYKNKTGFWQ